MTLRLMLVGLVASMGFELPTGTEVSAWARTGRDWACAMRASLSGPAIEADRPDAVPADCHQAEATSTTEPPVIVDVAGVPDDASFFAASEATAAEFATDWKSICDEGSASEDVSASLPIEPPPRTGLPVGEEPAEVVESDDLPGGATTMAEVSPARAERVRSAIRLTREAVLAWSVLLQESPDEAGLTR
jgi:hypothetical protein